MTIVTLADCCRRLRGLVAQVIVTVKKEGREELKVKGLTKEGVEEPVTVADTNSNNASVRFARRMLCPCGGELSSEL